MAVAGTDGPAAEHRDAPVGLVMDVDVPVRSAPEGSGVHDPRHHRSRDRHRPAHPPTQPLRRGGPHQGVRCSVFDG